MTQALSEAGEVGEEETYEDRINRVMESRKLLPNASYFPNPAAGQGVVEDLHRRITLSYASKVRYRVAVAKPRVYVETSISSFYVERRTAPDVVARREWTRQ